MKFHKRYFCYSIIILAFLCGCSVPATRETLQRAPVTCNLFLAGDLRRVINGTVRDEDMTSVASDRPLFALGGGTPDRMEEIGECIFIAGHGYTKSNDPAQDYGVVLSNNLQTPFLIGIWYQALPAEIIYLKGSQCIEEVYHELANRYGFFAVAGIGEFEELSTTALKKSPIYGEEIIAPENRARYFHPLTTLTQTRGIFFGVIQTMSSARIDKESTQRMFYINFADTTTTPALHSHTHVAIVDDVRIKRDMGKSRQFLSAMTAAQVKDVRHLLTQSRLKNALIMVYQIEHVSEY